MKLRTSRLIKTLLIPVIIIYLLFSLWLWNLNIATWGNYRWWFIFVSLIIYFTTWLILFISNYWDYNKFEKWFLYDEVEEMEKKNEKIAELNILSKRQLELLKESDWIRKETRNIFNTNINLWKE